MCFYMTDQLNTVFLNIKQSAVLTALNDWCHMELLPSRRVLCTPYNHAPRHSMENHKRKVHACLTVTCHLHFWQNDRDLLRATAVTRGWNEYRNESAQKVDLGKEYSPAVPAVLEPATFQSRVRRSYHCAIPAPNSYIVSWFFEPSQPHKVSQ